MLGTGASSDLAMPVMVHIAVHIAAVLHGMERTMQLPPHD